MKPHKFIVLLIGAFIHLLFVTGISSGCNLSDAEAIASAKAFCKKMEVSFSGEPWVLATNSSKKYLNSESKEVAFGERGNFKGTIKISCNSKEVCFYSNSELEDKVRNIHHIPSVTTEPHNWPPFLSETKAKDKIFAIAKKVGIPSDMEFSLIGLDKENGHWSGYWTRKMNGYPFEEDKVRIQVMAVNGEFTLYSKNYYGKPCPTEVKVTKDEAIKEGLKQIDRLFNPVPWLFRKHEIKSAELKIVQPNTLAGKMVSQHSTESRLAWVLHYVHKDADKLTAERKAVPLQSITIKIDAATKKFLGGARSR